MRVASNHDSEGSNKNRPFFFFFCFHVPLGVMENKFPCGVELPCLLESIDYSEKEHVAGLEAGCVWAQRKSKCNNLGDEPKQSNMASRRARSGPVKLGVERLGNMEGSLKRLEMTEKAFELGEGGTGVRF